MIPDSELEIQKAVHRFLSDPSRVMTTQSGRRIQILSPGRINVHPGPDFLDIGILLNGMVVVGDSEFHKKASYWQTHNHSEDENYNSVILHIVLENDFKKKLPFETLVISETDVKDCLNQLANDIPKIDLSSMDALQHYALIRLLRKASDAQKLLNTNSIEKALEIFSREYLLKYYSRRRRPVYDASNLNDMMIALPKSALYKFIDVLIEGSQVPRSEIIYELLKTKIADEGSHLRRELILNAFIPIALCLANDESRINIFHWYWSTPALNEYGVLKRKYPELPQRYLWQQQGMLEFMREHGRKPNLVAESIKSYGFAQILHFYRLGSIPFDDEIPDLDFLPDYIPYNK